MKPPCGVGRVRGVGREVGLRGAQRVARRGRPGLPRRTPHAVREDRGAYTTCNSSPFKYSPSGNAASSG